jgi:hypothetical protein
MGEFSHTFADLANTGQMGSARPNEAPRSRVRDVPRNARCTSGIQPKTNEQAEAARSTRPTRLERNVLIAANTTVTELDIDQTGNAGRLLHCGGQRRNDGSKHGRNKLNATLIETRRRVVTATNTSET